jgi:hypothetical protein
MLPLGWMGPQWGKPFLHVFILENNLLKSSPESAGEFQSNLIKIIILA